MKSKYIKISLLAGVLVAGCSNFEDKTDKKVVVDFSVNDSLNKNENIYKDSSKNLTVAVSAIISPRETFIYYEELLDYISKKVKHPIEIKQRKTYGEVNQMLLNNETDLAFICSGAYIRIKENSQVEILAVPVCNGKPYYQAYIITNNKTGIEKFEELNGKSFAFTDPLSNTGKLYPLKRLHDLNVTSGSFFSSTMYTHAHDISIQLVSKMVVDAASVDGLIYEYLASFYPERIKNIKIIEKSAYFGIPPVVVPTSVSSELKKKLKTIFLSIHNDSIGRNILDKLLIERFVEGNDRDYNSIRDMHEVIKP